MAITVNPYADRAAAQMAVEQQRQPQTVQQPYNLFAQQKQAGYPGVNTPQAGPRVAGEAGTVHSVPVTEPVAKTAPVQDTGGGQRKITPITNTDELAEAMGYTSPQEEERLRKASVANQRILAVGDALRHIGNIANTVNYAPAQQFNNPVAEEQARYEKGKALRDKANQTYLAYQQQKAAQDAKQKQWEAEYARKKEIDDWNIKKTEQQIRSQQEKDKRMEEMTAAKIAYQRGLIDDKEFNRKVKEYYMRLGLTPTGGALGGSRGRSGSGGGRPTQWQTRYEDFDYAKRNGIPVQDETTDMFGNKTTKRRDPNVVHAEVEEHRRKAGRQTAGNGKRSSGIK